MLFRQHLLSATAQNLHPFQLQKTPQSDQYMSRLDQSLQNRNQRPDHHGVSRRISHQSPVNLLIKNKSFSVVYAQNGTQHLSLCACRFPRCTMYGRLVQRQQGRKKNRPSLSSQTSKTQKAARRRIKNGGCHDQTEHSDPDG